MGVAPLVLEQLRGDSRRSLPQVGVAAALRQVGILRDVVPKVDVFSRIYGMVVVVVARARLPKGIDVLTLAALGAVE